MDDDPNLYLKAVEVLLTGGTGIGKATLCCPCKVLQVPSGITVGDESTGMLEESIMMPKMVTVVWAGTPGSKNEVAKWWKSNKPK